MFHKPNYTQVANDLVDKYLSTMTGAQVKVMLFLFRKIVGFHKNGNKDWISISQIQQGTGLSNREVIDTLDELEKLEMIRLQKRHGKTSLVTILFYEDERQEKLSTTYPHFIHTYEKNSRGGHDEKSSLVKKVHHTCEETSQVTGEESSHTKEIYKETYTKEKQFLFHSLCGVGMTKELAKEICEKYSEKRIKSVLNRLKELKNIRNPVGFVRYWLDEKTLPWEEDRNSRENQSKFHNFVQNSVDFSSIPAKICLMKLKKLGFSLEEVKKLLSQYDPNQILFEIDFFREKFDKEKFLNRLKLYE